MPGMRISATRQPGVSGSWAWRNASTQVKPRVAKPLACSKRPNATTTEGSSSSKNTTGFGSNIGISPPRLRWLWPRSVIGCTHCTHINLLHPRLSSMPLPPAPTPEASLARLTEWDQVSHIRPEGSLPGEDPNRPAAARARVGSRRIGGNTSLLPAPRELRTCLARIGTGAGGLRVPELPRAARGAPRLAAARGSLQITTGDTTPTPVSKPA